MIGAVLPWKPRVLLLHLRFFSRSFVGMSCCNRIPFVTGFFIRKTPDTFKFLRHVVRAIWSVRPKCSHRCVSLKEISLKPVQSLKHTTKNSTEQTVMRTKWFKHIAIYIVQAHLLKMWQILAFPQKSLTCFHIVFPFCPLCWPPLFPLFSGHFFTLFSPLEKCSVL